jgi:hypothetical protein
LRDLHAAAARADVRFVGVGTGARFTKRVFVRVRKEGGLGELGAASRYFGVESVRRGEGGGEGMARRIVADWVEEVWDPHVSLM